MTRIRHCAIIWLSTFSRKQLENSEFRNIVNLKNELRINMEELGCYIINFSGILGHSVQNKYGMVVI